MPVVHTSMAEPNMPRPDPLRHTTLAPSAQVRHDMCVDEECNLTEVVGTRICAARLISESLFGAHFLKKRVKGRDYCYS